jgi:hypothetical protein
VKKAEEINEYIKTHKGCTQTELRRVFNISDYSLKKMGREGLVKLPPVLHPSVAATRNRKLHGYYSGWSIK